MSQALRSVLWLALTALLLGGCVNVHSFDLQGRSDTRMLIDRDGQFQEPPPASAAWQPLDPRLLDSLPLEPSARVWFAMPLPAEAGTHAFLNSCTNVSALYQNQQLIQRDPLNRNYPLSPNLFMQRPLVPLPETNSSSTLYMQVIYSGRTQYAIDCLHLQVSTRYDALFLMLGSSGPELIAAFIAVFLGLLSLFLTLKRRQRIVTFFSLFVFTMAGIYFNASLLVKMVLGPIANWEALGHFSVLAAPVFFLLFFEEVMKPPYQLARKLAWLNTVFFSFELLAFLAIPDLNLAAQRRYFFFLILAEILIIPPLGVIGILQKRPFARSFGCGAVIVVAAAAHDVWANLFAQSKPFLLLPFSLVGFISLLLGILTRLATKEDASIEKQKLQLAEERSNALMHDVAKRTTDLDRHSDELSRLNQELSDKHEFLIDQAQKVTEYAEEKDRLLQQIHLLRERSLPAILNSLQQLHRGHREDLLEAVRSELHSIHQVFDAVASTYARGQHLRDRRFLIFDQDKKNQRFYKLALGGSKLELTLVSSEEEFHERLNELNFELIGLHEKVAASLSLAPGETAQSSLIIFHEDEKPLEELQHFPRAHYLPLYLPRILLQKLLLTHVTKLVTREIFGVEKYLGWGSMVKEVGVSKAEQHGYLLRSIRVELAALGLASEVIAQTITVAKHLLDFRASDFLVRAPYLRKAESKALLRYGYDATLFVLSMSLPGSLATDPEALFQGPGPENGEGRAAIQGLRENSDCLVFNSDMEMTHELLAIILTDPPAAKNRRASFHLFTMGETSAQAELPSLPNAGDESA